MNKKELFGIIGGIVVYGIYSAIKEKQEADKWAKNQKMIDEMRESFGEYASILHDEDVNYVRIRVRVGINRKFYLWLMQYGDGVELVSPAKERAEYLGEVRKMLGAYPEFAK